MLFTYLTRCFADDHFSSILEGTTDAVIMINHKGLIDYFNNAAERLFQYLNTFKSKICLIKTDIVLMKYSTKMPTRFCRTPCRQYLKTKNWLETIATAILDNPLAMLDQEESKQSAEHVLAKKCPLLFHSVIALQKEKSYPMKSFFNQYLTGEQITAVFVRDITDLVVQRQRADDVMKLILPASVAEHLKRDPDRIIARYYKV